MSIQHVGRVTVAAAPPLRSVAVAPPRALIASPALVSVIAEMDAELADSPPDVVRRESARLRRLAWADAALPPEPATIVYRLTTGDHQQTGIVVDVPLADYRDGLIRRHEAARPERVRQLDDFLEAARCELVPVTLAHRPRPRLRALLAAVATSEPDVHVVSPDGLEQSVWIEPPGPRAHEIQAQLADLGTLTIADGHHRMVAAERYAGRHGHLPSSFVLGALFATDEMRILGYHRGLARPPGASTSHLIEALAAQPGASQVEECGAGMPKPGTVSVLIDRRWFRIRLRIPPAPADPRDALDVVTLENGVLGPLLGVADPASDTRITPLPGTVDVDGLAQWCAEHDAIGFLLHPPRVEQVVEIADAGKVMPPKSTWFDPKARAGPFLRDLASSG